MTTKEFNDWLQEAFDEAAKEIEKYRVRRQSSYISDYDKLWRKYKDEKELRSKVEKELQATQELAEKFKKKYYKTLYKLREYEKGATRPTSDIAIMGHSERKRWLEKSINYDDHIQPHENGTFAVGYSYTVPQGEGNMYSQSEWKRSQTKEEAEEYLYNKVQQLYSEYS